MGVHPRGQHAVSAAPLLALPQQYEPAEDRDPPVLAVPRACRPRQLGWSSEGLPQPGLHPGECSRQVGRVGALQGGRGLTALAPQNHLQILLLLVFEAMVYRSQDYHRRRHQLAPLPAQAVCAEGTRQRLDRDLPSCLKYYVNFFFYKFGLEVRRGSTLAPSPGRGSATWVLATVCGAFAEQRLEGMGG